MSPRWLMFLSLISSAFGQEESVFDKAAREREAARQRAFDRGQRTALPAAEERASIGRLPDTSGKVLRSANGKIIKEGAPEAAVYNRVMETARFFKHYQDPNLYNANDSFVDNPMLAGQIFAETQRIYPELSQKNSAFALRFKAINRWVETGRPPLHKDARRALLVAHMVSLELTGSVVQDRFNLGQIPNMHIIGQRPPAFIKRDSFEIEVRGGLALLPDGLRGKVIRGQDKQPDIIEWLDAEGNHSLFIPKEDAGVVELFHLYRCRYRRTESLGGDYHVRFTPP